MFVGLGFLATVAALAALVTGGIVGGDTQGSTSADSRTQTYDESGQSQSGKNGTPSLSQRLKDAAQAQVDAEQKAEQERQAEAQADKERQAQADKERQAEGQSDDESQPQAQDQEESPAEGQGQDKRKAEGESEDKPQAGGQSQDERQAEREAAAQSSERSAERAKSDPKSVASNMIGDYDWGDSEFSCLEELWTNESQWDYTAENPSSGALGIPQSLPPEKMAEAGDDYETNPVTQIEWGLEYIDERYGSPCAALDFWNAQSPHWY